MPSSVIDTDRERRAARRAALRAVHPDLGGDAEAFIAVMRAFEQSHPTGTGTSPSAAGAAAGSGAAATGPGAWGARPVITTTVRSRTARRARRARRRLRALADQRPASWPGRHYTYVSEEKS